MTTPPLHKARVYAWPVDELKAHLGEIVDALAARRAEQRGAKGWCSPLDLVLELIGGELTTFLLVGHVGHLDPPRGDGLVAFATLAQWSDDPTINEKLREAVQKWLESSKPEAPTKPTWFQKILALSPGDTCEFRDAPGLPWRANGTVVHNGGPLLSGAPAGLAGDWIVTIEHRGLDGRPMSIEHVAARIDMIRLPGQTEAWP